MLSPQLVPAWEVLGGVALLEKYFTGVSFEVSKTPPFSVSLCLLLSDQDVGSQLFLPPSRCSSITDAKAVKLVALPCFLLEVALVVVFCNNRTVASTSISQSFPPVLPHESRSYVFLN